MKNFLKSVLVGVVITLSVNFFWFFRDLWWHYFFLVGYGAIGWYIAGYYNFKSKYETR